MTSYQWRILLVLLRKTYGWNKKEDAIALSQFSCATGIRRVHVCRALKELCKKEIVTQRGNGYITKYMFQKDFDKWKSLPNRVTPLPNGVSTVTQRGNKLLPNGGLTKDNKDNIQKKGSRFAPPTIETVTKYFHEYKTAPLVADPGMADAFFDWYAGNGWVQGKAKAPIKSWEAAARRWIRGNTISSTNGLSKVQQQVKEQMKRMDEKHGIRSIPQVDSVSFLELPEPGNEP